MGRHSMNTKNSTCWIASGSRTTLSHFGTIGVIPYICRRAAKQFHILEPWVDNHNFIGGKNERKQDPRKPVSGLPSNSVTSRTQVL